MIHLILGDKQEQSKAMNGKYGNRGDESEGDGRNSNHVNKDIKNNEGKIKLTQNGDDKNGEEKLIQDEDETTNDNSDDKNGEVSFRQTITKVILTQEPECDEENKGVNKYVICEQTQDITDNTQPNKNETVIFEQTQDITDTTQPDCVPKLIDTRRISTRSKKTQVQGVVIFYRE
jgi:hypothetical protein